MAQRTRKQQLHLSKMRELEKLSPFELKDKLINLAAEQTRGSTHQMLNAGRGNPNWIATTPREAFFTLGQFGIEESRRVWKEPDLGGMPQKKGIARRFRAFLDRNRKAPGADLLKASLDYGVRKLKFEADASSTNSPTASSATTIRCPTACSCIASRSPTSTWCRRCATGVRRAAATTSSQSKAARRPCATSSTRWCRTTC